MTLATRIVLMTALSYASLKTPSKNLVGQNRWKKEHARLPGLHIHDDTLSLSLTSVLMMMKVFGFNEGLQR